MKKIAFVTLIVFLGLLPTALFAQSDFYRGKTLTILQDSTPGGTGHLRTMALVPVLEKHIPGNPSVVIEFMPGAGGRKAANYLYSNPREDGLTVGRISSGVLSGTLLGLPGVQYDIDEFIYLGSGLSKGSHAFFTRKEAGADTLEKLKAAKGLRVGGQSVGHSNYVSARLFTWLLDLKEPRFVVGYSGSDLDAAILQGEIDARANSSETVIQRTPDFVNKGQMNFHGIAEYPFGRRFSHPAFADLPALHTFAKTDSEKKVMRMFSNLMQFTQAFVLPPGTSNEKVKILMEAFRKSWNDPEFLNKWKSMTQADASPLMPEELEELVKGIPRDSEAIKIYKIIAGAGPLPERQSSN